MKVSFLKMVCIAACAGSIAVEATPLADFNGSFEAREDGLPASRGWSLSINKTEGAKASGGVDSTTGTAKDGENFYRITVDSVSEENWHVQLKDPTWVAKKGNVYHMSLWLRADGERQAQISVYGGPSGKDAYRTSSGITLSTEWQQFDQIFTADTAGPGVINFALVCGFEPGVYDIDGVVIDEVEQGDNIYPNGTFEAKGAGWNLWVSDDSTGGAATLTFPEEGAHDGTYFGRVTVTEAAAETYMVQLQDGTWTSEIDAIYSVSLWAKADSERVVTLAAQAGSTRDYGYLDSYDLELTTEWVQYDWMYVPADSTLLGGPDSISFVIYCGGAAGVYDFDDISLLPDGTIRTSIKRSALHSARASKLTIALTDNHLRCVMGKTGTSPLAVSVFNINGQRYATYSIKNGKTFTLPRPSSGTWVVKAGSLSRTLIVP